ncbi:MAG: FAD-binding oxidoreductase [Alphaproteobacteria bacterium]|nr:FAD-binding oxidoreductase [Alphaproteobacteria bacterium]
MERSYDVVIVGGGVMGCSAAYWLAANPDFTGSILIVERDPTYATATTALSVGSIRQQFSTPENILMSLFGADFLARIGDYLAVEGEAPSVSLVPGGYLFLATQSGRAVLEANHRVQRPLGANNVILSAAELAARFPWLNTEGLAAGSLGLEHEGWLDPYGLLQAFRRKALALGAHYLKDRVTSIARQGGRIAAIGLAEGGTVACGTLINAAGPQAGAVASLAGVDLPVRPKKRFVFVVDCRTRIDCRQLVIDPSGVYWRPEGRNYLCGLSPPADQDPDCEDFEIDYSWFENEVWPVLAHRVPAFAELKLQSAWAGLYEYNTFDQNAILGPHPEVGNLHFINGFSGHGVQQSPAAGRAVSELVTYGAFRTLDLARFSYARIPANAPIKELNVV